jgi:hypothetical protein
MQRTAKLVLITVLMKLRGNINRLFRNVRTVMIVVPTCLSILTFQPVGAEVSINKKDCANPESVKQMVNEIWGHVGCTAGKNLESCAKFIGIAAATGTVGIGGTVAANIARGSAVANARKTPVPVVCPLRRSVGMGRFSLLAIDGAIANVTDCTPYSSALVSEADNLTKLAHVEMEVSIRSQQMQMYNQMHEVARAAKDAEYSGSIPATWEDQLKQRKIDSAYLKQAARVDEASAANLAREFDTLSSRLPAGERQRAERLIQQIRALGPDVDESVRFAAYSAIDDLSDMHQLRRPHGMSMLNPHQDPAIRRAEEVLQRRIHDLVQEKKWAYRQLISAGLKPDVSAGGRGQLWVDLSPAEKYELQRMSADANSTKFRIVDETRVAATATQPERVHFGQRGLSVVERRFPLMAIDPRVQDQWSVLRTQEERIHDMMRAHSQASSKVYDIDRTPAAQRAAAIRSLDDAEKLVASTPSAPAGSKAALERQILEERLKLLKDGKPFAHLPTEVLDNLGKQALASGIGTRGGVVGGAVIAGRVGMRFLGALSGVFGVVEMASAATGAALTGVEKLTGRDDINCKRNSPYLELDMSCNPVSGMNNRMMEFLKADGASQLAELKKSPELCEQLQSISAGSSPVENWSAQCSAPGEPPGFTLKSRSNQGQITASGSPVSKIEMVGTKGNPTRRVVSLNEKGEVQQIRVPRMGVARNNTEFEQLYGLNNPRFFRDVGRDAISSPANHVDRDAAETMGLVSSLWFAQAEVQACCEKASGNRSPASSPDERRCRGYLGEGPNRTNNGRPQIRTQGIDR